MNRKSNILNTTNHHTFLYYIIITLTFLCNESCKKFIDVPAPSTSVNTANVYSDDARAAAVITNLLAMTSNSNNADDGGIGSLSISAELSADNLKLLGTNSNYYTQFYQNNISPQYDPGIINGKKSFWERVYPLVYIANAAISGLNDSQTLTPAIKQRLLGEAYFLRAFYYFYLVNLYGDIPLAITTDYNVNARLTRSSNADVYVQILADLSSAISSLDDNYLDANIKSSTTERVRPTRQAAYALQSRVLLYLKRYADAEAAATKVIGTTNLYSVNIPLNTVFLKNSMETIWALQPVAINLNTSEGDLLTLPAAGPDASVHPIYLSSSLMANFDSADLRKTTWTNSVTVGATTYPFATKYKVLKGISTVTEYPIVLRLAEQYLIRSEARNEQNKLNDAQADLNAIRNRAGLLNTTAANQVDMRTAILKERNTELFTEWGHRWLDLKRTGNVDAVMQIATPLKGGGTWNTNKALYPIPLFDISKNASLTQNPGYSN